MTTTWPRLVQEKKKRGESYVAKENKYWNFPLILPERNHRRRPTFLVSVTRKSKVDIDMNRNFRAHVKSNLICEYLAGSVSFSAHKIQSSCQVHVVISQTYTFKKIKNQNSYELFSPKLGREQERFKGSLKTFPRKRTWKEGGIKCLSTRLSLSMVNEPNKRILHVLRRGQTSREWGWMLLLHYFISVPTSSPFFCKKREWTWEAMEAE